ncbi:PREDICTED: TGACG-sequence-specific DNA-binding protein TGA-1A-like isoform X1 [Ipomoea nil]|uniref:TGACG-sequence-specific DNA-binding protein TGA-1A-like isoform X1 n=1 Tax=Ipomoea nil TaxID=35883 RepID=UPI000900DDB3|nr:PREDICTED: TGACG-sequence-specific DNA-binding protein TGA-1A-like isoform X1 [Ipomoea nil]
MNSTYTQFVASKRMGICDPIHQLGMWGDFKGNGFATPPAATMILEVEKSLDNPMPVIAKTLDNQMEDLSQGSLGPSNKYEHEASKPIEKVLRRLAQNREAARKSRLRKKAYVQQLENSKLKLIQMEQELDRARQQGLCVSGGLDSSLLGYSGSPNSDLSPSLIEPAAITAFEMAYGHWVEEQTRRINDLRNALHSQVGDIELGIHVESCRNHYIDLFHIKATAAKADVCYIISGVWKTPAERLFLWIGGFRPSEILRVLMPHLELLTEEQHQSVSTLAQSCQQAEDALTQGMLKLHHFLADTVSAGQLGEENYLQQMHSAIEKLEHLIRFVNQADNLRELTLNQMSHFLTTRQAARGLLALGEYLQRLRTLSSLWANHPREAA